MIPDDGRDPIPEPELKPLPKGWATNPEVKNRHIAAFRRMIQTTFEPPEGLEGDGIVMCGGGKFWPGIVVAAKMLRDTGCKLPLHVYHRGSDEKVHPHEGMTIFDAEKINPKPRIIRGWETKTLAILHSGFRRVLYIDADAYCVADPTPLFDLLNKAPFVFWEDFENQRKTAKWAAYGLRDMSKDVPTIQGGHWLIDLPNFWREFRIAHWLNQHSDYFYQHAYGDQDQWRVVIAALGSRVLSLGHAEWKWPAFDCRHEGKSYIVHRCQGKMFPGEMPGRNDALPGESKAWEYFAPYAGKKPAPRAKAVAPKPAPPAIHPTANVYASQLGKDTKVAAFAEIGGATVGERCKIQVHASIPPGVQIGNEVFVGPGARFTNDKNPSAVGPWDKLTTKVEDGASIGAGAVILPGLTVGRGARVGAGAVVTENVPDGAIVAGNPAKRIKTPRDVLLILNPRRIDVAWKSLSALPIDRVWFRGFTEPQLVPQISRFIEQTSYTNYLMVADDVIVPVQALEAVQALLRECVAATGYCKLAADDNRVNLTRAPMQVQGDRPPVWRDYDFYTLAEVQKAKGICVSWFGGWALTGMRRKLWLRYPFRVNASTGAQTDFELANRMARDGRCFRFAPGALIEHLKPGINGVYRKGWLVGKEPATIILEHHEP
jgi:acetyltransferase-like isoleucine patch superfamily enzyme